MSDKQRALGQFATPPDVADLLLGFCLRQAGDRLLDPSCGEGAILGRAALLQAWLAQSPRRELADTLWGVELDEQAAAEAQLRIPQARILRGNFFSMEPEDGRLFDTVVGNPPYTRAEWFGRLENGAEAVEQLAIFNGSAATAAAERPRLTRKQRPGGLGGRAGLHAYFFVHATRFLREGGRFGFVVPNSWLDVAYGERLKHFLLDHFKIVALIESNVERWFEQARVNTCLVILERCGDAEARADNRVRLARLERPLAELTAEGGDRYERLERLATRLLPLVDLATAEATIQVLSQRELTPARRWGAALRAPGAGRRRRLPWRCVPLGSWARVQRGFTTGANQFFYLNEAAQARWAIEPEYRRPLLKSLRGVRRLRVEAADCQRQVLLLPATGELESAAAAYVAWGEEQGIHRRRTCSGRRPWYCLRPQPPADLVLAKGVWERHFALALGPGALVDQQLYQISLAPGVPPAVAAALLNSSWFALQLELNGRVNFGEGVLWLAAYELEELLLPDPRLLAEASHSRLEGLFARLAARPVATTAAELEQDDRQELDEAVFELLEFGAAERAAVVSTLLERVVARRAKAATVAG